MKVEVKKINDIKHELTFEVSKERVAKTLNEVYKQLGKNVKIKGFRPGKVPKNILQSKYSAEAQEETLKKIIPEIYSEGIAQEKLLPIAMPEIGNVSFKDGVITFLATLEIRPEVKIKDYKGIKVTRKSSKVTEDDLNKTLEYFKQGQGSDKEIKIDDDFAKGLGYPNLEDFKKSLERQIEMDKDRQNKADVDAQIIKVLMKVAKVDAPESVVASQMEQRLKEVNQRLSQQGLSEEDISKKVEEMKKELKKSVETDVKTYFVLEKIGELEGITVKEGENLPTKVMEFLLKEAKWEEKK